MSQKGIYGWGGVGSVSHFVLWIISQFIVSPCGNHRVVKMHYWAVSRYRSLSWVLGIYDQQEWASIYGKQVWHVLKVSGECGVKKSLGIGDSFSVSSRYFHYWKLGFWATGIAVWAVKFCLLISLLWCFDSHAFSNPEPICGGGLFAKSCQTLVIPWPVAC